MKNLLKHFFEKYLGIDIKYAGKKNRFHRMSLLGVLENLKAVGFYPKSVIDVGAAFGGWSAECSKIFPEAEYLMIEPLKEYNDALGFVVGKIEKAKYLNYAVTRNVESVSIYVHKDLVGSSLKKEVEEYNQDNAEMRVVNGISLDRLYEQENFIPPYLVKLDVQGAELDVLAGASKVMEQAEVFILEVSLFKSFQDGRQLADIVEFMKNKGFVVYDIFGFLYRPFDNALSQVDMAFVSEKSDLRKFHGYATKKQRDSQDEKFTKQLKNKIV